MNKPTLDQAKLPVMIFLAIVALLVFKSGLDAAEGHWIGFVVNIAFAGIMFAIAYLIGRDSYLNTVGNTLHRVDELEALVEAHGKAAEAAAARAAAMSHERQLENALSECIDDVIKTPRKPRTDDLEKIKQLFHERTDHHVKLTITGSGLDASIAATPFPPEKKPRRKPAPKKPGNKASDVPVRDAKTAGKRPLGKVK